jgi:glutaredoxin 3
MNKSYKIIIYTSDNCSFCQSVKAIFKEKKLKFKEINISKNEKLKNEMIKKSNGMMTVPQIFVNSKHIGGYKELINLDGSKKKGWDGLDAIINK